MDDASDTVDSGADKVTTETPKPQGCKRRRDDDEPYDRELKGLSNFLLARIDDRRKGQEPRVKFEPRRLIEEKISKWMGEKHYKEALEELSTTFSDKPTQEQIAKIEDVKSLGPNYLGRTASRTAGTNFNMHKPPTNGLTLQRLMMPAADTYEKRGVHEHLTDLTQGELKYILGKHLIWDDIADDPFLSHTIDALFLVVHALDRKHEGQGGVAIQFFDRRKALNPKGEVATFYPALKLYEAFEVPRWTGWTKPNTIALQPYKFTQEFLSHGTIKIDDTRFRQASIESLIEDGLFDIFPAFEISQDRRREGLYTGQVYFRTVGYPPPPSPKGVKDPPIYSYDNCAKTTPFSVEFLQKVQKMTKNFMYTAGDDCEPHLHIFISFLTFEKRLVRDPVYIDWIRTHYCAADVLDLHDDGQGGSQEGFTHVANNLPGVMQYLDLVRDAIYAFGLAQLPPNVVQTQNPLTNKAYAEEDYRLQKKCQSSKEYDVEKQTEKRSKEKDRKKRKKSGVTTSDLQDALNGANPGVSTQEAEMDEDEIVDAPDTGGIDSGDADLLSLTDFAGPINLAENGGASEDACALRVAQGV